MSSRWTEEDIARYRVLESARNLLGQGVVAIGANGEPQTFRMNGSTFVSIDEILVDERLLIKPPSARAILASII